MQPNRTDTPMIARSLASALIAACMAVPASTPAIAQAGRAAGRFAVVGDHFELDNHPYVIRSGEMHYLRVPRELWRARLRQARAMGLNTITTYAFWSQHEPEPGKFDFSGDLDLASYIRIAREEGLNVILRPGPYVCAEFDLGGMPAWLLRTPGLRPRTLDPRFLAASARWLKRLEQEVTPLLSSHGGPILMVQVENEYGNFGADRDYMEAIRRQFVDAGFDVPLFTSDSADPHALAAGTLPSLTAVVNFDGEVADVVAAFDELARFRPGGPRMAGEYWAGWFDHWGETHHTTPAARAANAVDWMLARGISFNLYMFHGGTSSGWLAGANDISLPFQPDTTSYDYDAPLDESGRPTPKYAALRAAIARHLPPGDRLPEPPPAPDPIAIPRFALEASVGLQDALGALAGPPVRSHLTRTMEDLGQGHGLVLYRKRLASAQKGTLTIEDVHDFAVVMVDGRPIGELDRRTGAKSLPVDIAAGATLDVLVEGMGHINFGQHSVDDSKGITRSVSMGDDELLDWEMSSLTLDDLSALRFETRTPTLRGPRFWRGGFTLDRVSDTFLDMRGLGLGHAWINGHHLGSFWRIGPQQTLHVPAAWLRRGRNEVVVFDLQAGTRVPALEGLTSPVFETPAVAPPAGGATP
jgi:beta-galactosidase